MTKVIIVGAGIGGTACALALLKHGLDVTLLEQASAFGEVGAGVQMSPNANRVIDALCNADHSLLEVRRTGDGGWAFDWPFTEVMYDEPEVAGDGNALRATLSRHGHSCEADFQLADSQDVLILRLGSPDAVAVVYRRSE